MSLSALRTDPTNPRTITKAEFEWLKKSIEADPDFMRLRPVLADASGLIYAGRMRYEAHVKMGHDVIYAVCEDVDELTRRKRRLLDNTQFGSWDDALLSEEVYALREEGVDLHLLGFDDKEIARALALSGADGDAGPSPEKTATCPQCGATFNP